MLVFSLPARCARFFNFQKINDFLKISLKLCKILNFPRNFHKIHSIHTFSQNAEIPSNPYGIIGVLGAEIMKIAKFHEFHIISRKSHKTDFYLNDDFSTFLLKKYIFTKFTYKKRCATAMFSALGEKIEDFS